MISFTSLDHPFSSYHWLYSYSVRSSLLHARFPSLPLNIHFLPIIDFIPIQSDPLCFIQDLLHFPWSPHFLPPLTLFLLSLILSAASPKISFTSLSILPTSPAHSTATPVAAACYSNRFPCHSIYTKTRFYRTSCSLLATLKMEPPGSSEKLVIINQSPQCHISEY
jgi:hypothetical protein